VNVSFRDRFAGTFALKLAFRKESGAHAQQLVHRLLCTVPPQRQLDSVVQRVDALQLVHDAEQRDKLAVHVSGRGVGGALGGTLAGDNDGSNQARVGVCNLVHVAVVQPHLGAWVIGGRARALGDEPLQGGGNCSIILSERKGEWKAVVSC
jgi:hypothetical protein